MQESIKLVRVDASIADYIVRLSDMTRHDARLRLGVSPRGSLAIYRAAQAARASARPRFCDSRRHSIARGRGPRPPDRDGYQGKIRRAAARADHPRGT